MKVLHERRAWRHASRLQGGFKAIRSLWDSKLVSSSRAIFFRETSQPAGELYIYQSAAGPPVRSAPYSVWRQLLNCVPCIDLRPSEFICAYCRNMRAAFASMTGVQECRSIVRDALTIENPICTSKAAAVPRAFPCSATSLAIER